jgi:hypothetical protein
MASNSSPVIPTSTNVGFGCCWHANTEAGLLARYEDIYVSSLTILLSAWLLILISHGGGPRVTFVAAPIKRLKKIKPKIRDGSQKYGILDGRI